MKNKPIQTHETNFSSCKIVILVNTLGKLLVFLWATNNYSQKYNPSLEGNKM